MNHIDFIKEQPFNLIDVVKFTDDMIDMLSKLNILHQVFYNKINHLRECKFLYDVIRHKYPELFNF